jgi:hypothetical protein
VGVLPWEQDLAANFSVPTDQGWGMAMRWCADIQPEHKVPHRCRCAGGRGCAACRGHSGFTSTPNHPPAPQQLRAPRARCPRCSCPPESISVCGQEAQIVQQLSSQGLTWPQLAERRPAMTPGAAQLLRDAAAALDRYDDAGGPALRQLEQLWEQQPALFQGRMDTVTGERLAAVMEALGRRRRQHGDVEALYQHLLPGQGPAQRLAAERQEGQRELARLLLERRRMLPSFVDAQGPFSFGLTGEVEPGRAS